MIDSDIDNMSDDEIVAIMGAFIKHHRLEQNKTQEQLAKEADINRSTLVEFEKGMRSNIITFIQLLRALHLLQTIEQFKIVPQGNQIQLSEFVKGNRKRASKTNKKNNPDLQP